MDKASCLCGTVNIEIETIIGDYVCCHCKSCRKSSGSAFAANVSVPIDSFKVVEGESAISTYESSPGKVRHFCGQCASPLFTKVGANPAVIRLRIGSLDTEFQQKPSAHIFMSHKAAWDPTDSSIPQFEEWPSTDIIKIHGSHQPDD